MAGVSRRRRPAYARRRSEDEASFQRTVVHFASLTGWRWYHPPDNRPNERGRVQAVQAGFPDLWLVRRTRIIVAELKTETGRLSDAQRAWIGDLQAFALSLQVAAGYAPAGVLRPTFEVYVWRPSDWPEIEGVLAPDEGAW